MQWNFPIIQELAENKTRLENVNEQKKNHPTSFPVFLWIHFYFMDG